MPILEKTVFRYAANECIRAGDEKACQRTNRECKAQLSYKGEEFPSPLCYRPSTASSYCIS